MLHLQLKFLSNARVTIKKGGDPDNLERGYNGKHEKESFKSLQTRSPHGAFCFGIDSAKLSPMNWKPKAKLCLAEKLKLMKATLVADGKENVGAVQCN